MKYLGNKGLPSVDFEEMIQYQFKDKQLLKEALTHSSYANESKVKKIKHNERLEFLGDSVLGIIISDYIFKKYTHLPEGDLTKVRANVVCEPALGSCATKINLGGFLRLGRGEEVSGGRQRESILADAFEALIGALYLDGGMVIAQTFVLNHLIDSVEQATKGSLFRDYKTYLQELLQSKHSERITYQVIKESGPDHSKIFDVEVLLGEQLLGHGMGKSKKEAEQRAAKEAVEKIKDQYV
ncbi:Ribonuclease III [Alkaliphilus metalliredigens QYMF]|uniref:Ribonuclease 3 n=1 Tax=Alkaliphilus metalliredigens (strain QYMF) TaxID=293826 RepID=A6TRT5_ALKMQ|nr:ribonuclease III [Alkaliphilus metalliredigens]ABR48903.1 Ribonuclease III [Alkaliphilus metalliredigens QYMF]